MTDVIDHTSLLPRRFAERLFKSFESDARLIQNQFSMLTDEVRAVKTSMTNFIRHPLDDCFNSSHHLQLSLSGALERSDHRRTSSVFCGQDMRPVGALDLSQTFRVVILVNEVSRIRF
jgi:hypothetical protein